MFRQIGVISESETIFEIFQKYFPDTENVKYLPVYSLDSLSFHCVEFTINPYNKADMSDLIKKIEEQYSLETAVLRKRYNEIVIAVNELNNQITAKIRTKTLTDEDKVAFQAEAKELIAEGNKIKSQIALHNSILFTNKN